MPPASLTEVETPQSRCRFALAWGDITPPANIYHRMWGAAKHECATGIHRPLRATVTVFEAARAGDLQSPSAATDAHGRRLQVAGTGPRQTLLALDHCVLGAVEHRQLVEHIA